MEQPPAFSQSEPSTAPHPAESAQPLAVPGAGTPIRSLEIALVPGISPGKWLDRWAERRPDIPFAVDTVAESAQLDALADHQLLFARTGQDGAPVRQRRDLLTIPLYEEQPVVVVPRDHLLALADECPVRALSAADLLDVGLLGYEQAIELAGNGAGVVVVPQAVARHLGRKDTVVLPLTDADPADLGLEAPGDDDAVPRDAGAALLAPTRVWLCFAAAWQDDHGVNHPVIEEFIGVVRGRKAESSRQPSVQERQQEEARRRLKERQSSEPRAGGKGAGQKGAGQKGAGAKKAGGTPKRTARPTGSGKPPTGSRARKRGQR